MREIAFYMAQKYFETHMPDADKEDKSYKVALLQYAESMAQTYILAGVSPGDFNEAYHDTRD